MSKTASRVGFLLLCWGCGGNETPVPEYPPLDEPDPTTTASLAPPVEAPPAPEPTPPVTVLPGERTPLEGDAPTIRLRVPRNGQKVRPGKVSLRIQLRKWDLSEAPGNHVHVIVDNNAYIAIRDVSSTIDLDELVKEKLGKDLEEGTHVVRVFPSRPTHESVKEGEPFAAHVFHVKAPTDEFEFDPKAPLLTYSRPKGCYVHGERVMLDFYLTNVPELKSDGHRVRYTIDGDTTGEITKWSPHYIVNLSKGEHQIRLQLIDGEGAAVEGPFNDTTRTITVADACEAPAPAPAQSPAAEDSPAKSPTPADSQKKEKGDATP